MNETWGEAFREFKENLKSIDQLLAGVEQDARHPHLAMEADVPADTKTRERTEGAAQAVQTVNEDSLSEKGIQDGLKSSTTFGQKLEPTTLPCRDDVVVNNGAAAPKLCLSPLEMRSPTAAGGLLPTGKTISTASDG